MKKGWSIIHAFTVLRISNIENIFLNFKLNTNFISIIAVIFVIIFILKQEHHKERAYFRAIDKHYNVLVSSERS